MYSNYIRHFEKVKRKIRHSTGFFESRLLRLLNKRTLVECCSYERIFNNRTPLLKILVVEILRPISISDKLAGFLYS